MNYVDPGLICLFGEHGSHVSIYLVVAEKLTFIDGNTLATKPNESLCDHLSIALFCAEK